MNESVWGTPFHSKHTKLSIDRKVYEHLIAAGRKTLPYEYTALLAGSGSHISAWFSPPLGIKEKDRFQWDAAAFLGGLKLISQARLQWLGIVHTHPATAAVPSVADLTGWHYPEQSYWILSLAMPGQPDLRAYQLTNGSFTARPYMIEE
ncbi:MAG: M67 family metallopeptidase [Clostridia bacterium]